MEIKPIVKKKNEFVLELVGESHTFGNVLKEFAWEFDPTASACREEHPLSGNIQIMVKSKDVSPVTVLTKSADKVKKTADEFGKKFSAAVKK